MSRGKVGYQKDCSLSCSYESSSNETSGEDTASLCSLFELQALGHQAAQQHKHSLAFCEFVVDGCASC